MTIHNTHNISFLCTTISGENDNYLLNNEAGGRSFRVQIWHNVKRTNEVFKFFYFKHLLFLPFVKF